MDYVAFEAPAWLWIGAIATLFAFGGACGALLYWALGLRHTLNRLDEYEENTAAKADVERELAAIREELARVRRRPQSDTLVSSA